MNLLLLIAGIVIIVLIGSKFFSQFWHRLQRRIIWLESYNVYDWFSNSNAIHLSVSIYTFVYFKFELNIIEIQTKQLV